jgi:hypothetical protein
VLAFQEAVAECAEESSTTVADHHGFLGIVVKTCGLAGNHHGLACGHGSDAPEERRKNFHPQLRLTGRAVGELPEV